MDEHRGEPRPRRLGTSEPWQAHKDGLDALAQLRLLLVFGDYIVLLFVFPAAGQPGSSDFQDRFGSAYGPSYGHSQRFSHPSNR
jgi:hypothetical protein